MSPVPLFTLPRISGFTPRTYDKSGWGSGPWTDEPDHVLFTDPANGLPCAVLRGPCGHLCGYVGVPAGHRLFGESWNSRFVVGSRERQMLDRPVGTASPIAILCSGYADPDGIERVNLDLLIDVHGGITYAKDHLPGQPSANSDHWWFGFDCAHSGDLTPADADPLDCAWLEGSTRDGIYRTLSYVCAECAKLARQLQELAT